MRNFTRFTLQLVACWVVLLGIGCGMSFGQDFDWKWQNPLPQGNALLDVHFLDTQTGWAVGSNGTILKTTNGGLQWQVKNSGTTATFLSVHFTDPQNGWVVGPFGTILKTSNGGDLWQVQNSGTDKQLNSVHFIDSQTGWAVGKSATILKTVNGGQIWQVQSTSSPYIHDYNTVHFIDAQTGWVAGEYSTILKTNNGGSSWQGQIANSNQTYNSIYFINAQIGWAVGNAGTIFQTLNGGQQWQEVSSGTTKRLISVHFTNAQNGCIVGESGTILKYNSTGGGFQASGTKYQLLSVHFTDSQTGWAVGDKGTILKTSNAGQLWHAQSSGTIQNLRFVQFTDSLTGWAGGSDGIIWKTNNGGQGWQAQSFVSFYQLNSIHFINNQTGWAVDGTDIVRKTNNGGQLWQDQNTGINCFLTSIHFIDAQTGWAVGAAGTILKTSDGGQLWQAQSSGTTNQLNSVHFINAQTGWAVGNGGTILETINGGQQWQAQSSGTTNHLFSIYILDNLNAWVVGSGGTIRRTNNAGALWLAQTSGTPYQLNSIHFTDPQTGWAVGNAGTILKTGNAGQDWQAQRSCTTNDLLSVHFTDQIHGWSVGSYGSIITTSTNNYFNNEIPLSLVQGNLFEKTASNCNPSSTPVPNRLVKAMPGPYYGISNKLGAYNLRLPLADSTTQFTLQALVNPNPVFQVNVVCPANNLYTFSLDTLADTLTGKDFGFEITQCHHLNVEIASNRRRRCLRNTTTISFVNQGSTAVPDAYILVEFPHWVQPVSASIPYMVMNDSTWKFSIDIVSAGESGSFSIIDSVICGHPEIRNLTQCTKATIYPAPDCPSPSWNGSAVSAGGTCLNGFASFTICNKTGFAMTDSVDYWLYLDSIQIKTGKLKITAGDSVQLWVETDGKTAHLTVNQVAYHPTEIFVAATVERCGSTQAPVISVNNFPRVKTPNSKTHCLPIRDSYDPNDKQAFPIGFTASHVVKPGTEMEYLVRFQNTGNDTAFTVYVIDSLDNNLNVESLEIGAVSHPYEITLQTTKSGRNFLRFQFNNIMLPDSITNELKSHGYIQYRISPKSDLAPGAQARNNAEIYFDFNPAVYTNQTLTTFDHIVFTDTTLNDLVFNEEPVTPTLSTTLLSNITLTSAISGGTISSDGGPDVTIRGVVWSTFANPTIALSSKTMDGSGTGTFSSSLFGLNSNTTYYVRAYATNPVGTSYGEERQFTTLSPATMATVLYITLTNIATTTATTSSRISGDGGAAVTARGVVWNTAPEPTIALPTKTQDGADTGTFASNLTGLQPATGYYVRTYATNSVGTSYGEERQFNTLFVTVADALTSGEIRLYPNPFRQMLHVENTSGNLLRLSVCDVLGKEVYNQTVSNKGDLSLGLLSAGVYYVRFPDLGRVIKVVKE